MPEKELPKWPIYSTLTIPFRRGGSRLLAHADCSTRARVRDLNGTARGIASEPRKRIANKYMRHREILPRLRGSTRVLLRSESDVDQVPIHAAGFAMLSLAPVMDLDVPS